MSRINVPTYEEVSVGNQVIFDQLKKKLGFVPNLYATLAHSEHALGNYLAFQNAKSSINGKDREVVNLAVSQVNECEYCLAAHTVIGGMIGFSADQILEMRSGRASWDAKLEAGRGKTTFQHQIFCTAAEALRSAILRARLPHQTA